MKVLKGWTRLKVGDMLLPGDRYFAGGSQWFDTTTPYTKISAFKLSLAGAYIRKAEKA